MSVKYNREHEWIRRHDEVGVVGISAYAQEQLGDVVFVDPPAVGARFSQGDEAAVIESVKAASEVYAPVSGEITEVNQALADTPGAINQDPLGEGWIFKTTIDDAAELDALMDEDAYQAYVEGLE
jgi:glycine cleavage system H protein